MSNQSPGNPYDTQMLSVVMPVYNEAQIIAQGVLRTSALLREAGIPFEMILVDDGSRDGTWAQLSALSDAHDWVTSIQLSRNFGKEGAMSAGIDAARGACVAVMDCDMQHPPEVLLEMYRLWRDEGYQVVEGVKTTRGKESRAHAWAANTFYGLLRASSGIDLHNASDFRLMDREAVEALKRMPERQTFFRAMSTWVGYRRTQVPFEVAPRAGGTSRFSVRRLVMLATNAITSFSATPLQLVTVAGAVLLGLFLLLGIQTVYMKLSGRAVEGFTTVILLLLIIGGTLMMALGIIGVYIAKIYEEVKGRPRYLVQSQSQSQSQAQAQAQAHRAASFTAAGASPCAPAVPSASDAASSRASAVPSAGPSTPDEEAQCARCACVPCDANCAHYLSSKGDK